MYRHDKYCVANWYYGTLEASACKAHAYNVMNYNALGFTVEMSRITIKCPGNPNYKFLCICVHITLSLNHTPFSPIVILMIPMRILDVRM